MIYASVRVRIRIACQPVIVFWEISRCKMRTFGGWRAPFRHTTVVAALIMAANRCRNQKIRIEIKISRRNGFWRVSSQNGIVLLRVLMCCILYSAVYPILPHTPHLRRGDAC